MPEATSTFFRDFSFHPDHQHKMKPGFFMIFPRNLIKRGLDALLPDSAAAGTGNEPARVAWIEKTIKSFPADWTLLDAGAGEQQFRKFCDHLNYVSQDFGQYNGAGDGIGLQTGSWDQSKLDIVGNITDIPRPDASFDAIMCTEVFEHLPDPIKAIREFSRLLRKGGKLLLTAPFCSLTHFAPYHFYTGFNRYFYETHLADHGFIIDELSCNGDYFQFLAQEIKRVPWAAATYCGSKPDKIEALALKTVANLLGRMSRRDSGSSTLLNFGMHILATRS
jgi:SAM-dependent methyltransferase